MRALLIGGTGFLSTVLARRLWADGHDVAVVARGLAPDDCLPRDVERLRADRYVPGSLDKVLERRSFDVVYDFHAHQTDAPRQVFALLPDRRRMGRYVLVSSIAVYAQPRAARIDEDHAVRPGDGYGRGKEEAERAAIAAGRATGIPLTIVRPNETLGPRDTSGRRFLHLVARAARGLPIVVPGKLATRLTWGYVDDLARLLVLAGLSDVPGTRIYNAAGGETFTFGDYVGAVLAAVGRSVPVLEVGWTFDQYSRCELSAKVEWHLNCWEDTVVDASRARVELGWEPRTGLVEAVFRTVRWLERERRDVLLAEPRDQDAVKALEAHARPASVPAKALDRALAEDEDLPQDDPAAVAWRTGDRLARPTREAPAVGDEDARTLDPLELAVSIPLWRDPEPLDRPALLGEAAHLARGTGALAGGAGLEALDEALERLHERDLVIACEKDGMPGYRATARGWLAVLAAVARPPEDVASAPTAALLLRVHVLARTAYLGWIAAERPARDHLDPHPLGVPFEKAKRLGTTVVPEGVVEALGGFDAFARAFHAALDGEAVIARWRGALRLARTALETEVARLAEESRAIDREAHALVAGDGPPPLLVHEIRVIRAEDETPEVFWVKRAEVERRTLLEPRIVAIEGVLASLALLREMLAGLRRGEGAVRLGPTPPPPAAPREGNVAPDFLAPAEPGPLVRLSEHRGRWVVLYFYPVDDTPGCTLEACKFRDADARFRAAGAMILGVSADGLDRHRAFREKHGLPFALVADDGGRIARAYGVFDEQHRWAERVTFVIGPDGRIARVFRVGAIETHADEVLAAIGAGGT